MKFSMKALAVELCRYIWFFVSAASTRHLVPIIFSCLLAPFATANPTQLMDVEMVVYDDRFYEFIEVDSQVEILASELEWAEGPVWVKGLDSLLFSDVAVGKVYQWSDAGGLSVYLQPSGHAPDGLGQLWRGSNGLAIDENGSLLLAQQSNRTLARMLAPITQPTPDYDILVSHYRGKSINSPNDLVVHRSGDIYFTDPPYGLSGFEKSPDIELDFFGVFRLTKSGELIAVTKRLRKPNGIALSNDQSVLYVSDSAKNKAQIVAIELDHQGNFEKSRLFFDGKQLISEGSGSTDGMVVHPSDFLFVSIPNGVGVLSPEGALLGKIVLGQVTNMTLNDTFSQLYITSPKKLMRLKINSIN
ncbi:SMP-30/gluconolactonase/LRE family protein [Halieaceae bacterium IMCC14734]|uniref:SMP-30/gluconolactonase/LRE family protein n=1 Tax=Candidatus Litorirhabdus singularis TaxID=2518993 RepID=A0ABT3TIB2_9GAMM|nr:SMP-30/gluconolactonase/LRE family protein [Candidatus Litorirhabdus singularis]MCX2982038.1 SMP-30/gluconolactonase/LRE family protein [Candidatus Litorirhabdus singularis]